MLDLVNPAGSRRRLGSRSRQARVNRGTLSSARTRRRSSRITEGIAPPNISMAACEMSRQPNADRA